MISDFELEVGGEEEISKRYRTGYWIGFLSVLDLPREE